MRGGAGVGRLGNNRGGRAVCGFRGGLLVVYVVAAAPARPGVHSVAASAILVLMLWARRRSAPAKSLDASGPPHGLHDFER